jgi:hypothetical protein
VREGDFGYGGGGSGGGRGAGGLRGSSTAYVVGMCDEYEVGWLLLTG